MTTQTQTIEIESLTKWSEPCEVQTKLGPRMLRKGIPDSRFWAAWKSDKPTLKAAGVSVGKDIHNGAWEICWWQLPSKAHQEAVEATQEASRATDADIDVPCPEGLEYLPYQRAGIAYAMDRPATLIGDEMGLGKTIEAIGVFNAVPTIRKVLIVCPASLRLNWEREWLRWAARPWGGLTVIQGGKAQFPKTTDVVIVNYDVLDKHRKQIDARNWDLLIVDEVQYAKNPSAKRTRALFGWALKDGKIKLPPIKAKRKLFLTGTPIVNRPIELWPMIRSIDPNGLGKSFFPFAVRYCAAHKTHWGWDFTGASHLDELQRRLREKFMVRRLKKDVLTELPAKRRQVIELPANGAGEAVAAERAIWDGHQQYIEDLEKRIQEAEFCDDLGVDSDEIESMRKELAGIKRVAFEELSKVRHETALAKVPMVIEHLETALEGGPVVCFAHHRDVIAQIVEHFGDRAESMTGTTSMPNRQKMVDRFQNGKIDLLVGNEPLGIGWTLTRSSHVVMAELDWVPGNLSQREDRCHRIGQVDSVLVQHLVLEDSVDSLMVQKLIVKQDVIDRALDTQSVTVKAHGMTIHGDAKSVALKQQLLDWIEPDYQEDQPTHVTIKPDVVTEKAKGITPSQINAIHAGLRALSGMCDGAVELDGCGFNKFDSRIGKQLAAQDDLSPRQAVLAQTFISKYRRQLPNHLVETAGVKVKSK